MINFFYHRVRLREDYAQCENRKCSIEMELPGCYACKMDCKKGLLNKIKPYGFTLFIKIR